jgi:hypothetical protein
MPSDLFDEHAVARRTDPGTSHEAARSVDRIRETQQAVLDVLHRYGPCSDEKIFALMRPGLMSPSGARTRRKELNEKGKVRDTGHRAKTASGRNTIIWEAI